MLEALLSLACSPMTIWTWLQQYIMLPGTSALKQDRTYGLEMLLTMSLCSPAVAELLRNGRMSPSADVYSFGILSE